MHLAYLHYLSEGATGRLHVEQVAAAARGLGHRVDTYAMNLAPASSAATGIPTLRSAARQFLKKRLGRYLHEPKELLWNLPYAAKEIKLLRDPRPDVLVVRDHLLTASCVFVARRLDLPLILEVNAPAVESRLYYDEYAHLPFLPEWLESWKLHSASMVVVVSSALREYLFDNYKVEREKILVNPNGADIRRFQPGLAPEAGLPDGFKRDVVVGFVGSFQRFHGSSLIARMALRVAETRPAVRFLFVGDGPEATVVREATERLGERVLFTGSVDRPLVSSRIARPTATGSRPCPDSGL